MMTLRHRHLIFIAAVCLAAFIAAAGNAGAQTTAAAAAPKYDATVEHDVPAKDDWGTQSGHP